MPEIGDWYECPVCGTIIQIVTPSDAVPFCCSTEMELMSDTASNSFTTDKNVCGAVVKCEKCGLEALVHQDGGGLLECCLEEMSVLLDTGDRESGNIYRCPNCGQVLKIEEPGCGPLTCCDNEICALDVDKVESIEDKIAITMESYDTVPYNERRLFCKECGRVLTVLKAGKGTLECHGEPMGSTLRYGFYFQVGG